MKPILYFLAVLSILISFPITSMQSQQEKQYQKQLEESLQVNKDELIKRLNINYGMFKVRNVYENPLSVGQRDIWNAMVNTIGEFVNKNAPELLSEYKKLKQISTLLLVYLIDVRDPHAIKTEEIQKVINNLNNKILILPGKRNSRELLIYFAGILKDILSKLQSDYYIKFIKPQEEAIKRKKEAEAKAQREKEAQAQRMKEEQERRAKAEQEEEKRKDAQSGITRIDLTQLSNVQINQLVSEILTGKKKAANVEILGGFDSKKETINDVRNKARKLLIKWHPDKFDLYKNELKNKLEALKIKLKNDEQLRKLGEEIFKIINNAYDAIGRK